MRKEDSKANAFDQSHDEAAQWVVKVGEGLSDSEQAAFEEWLAADERNAERFEANQRVWSDATLLKDLTDAAELLGEADGIQDTEYDPGSKSIWWRHPLTWAAAACVTVGSLLFLGGGGEMPEQATGFYESYSASTLERRFLPDGSLIEMKAGTVLEARFSTDERTVSMQKGEAYFSVTENADRPFIVNADGTAFRALGTAFSVELADDAVSLLVTEGVVRVETGPPTSLEGSPDRQMAATETDLRPSQSTVIPRKAVQLMPEIRTLSGEEIDAALSWKRETLDFGATPLAEVVAEFNKRNRDQIILAEESLAGVEIDGTFRSDNLPAFVRLLELSAGIKAKQDDTGRIVLSR